MTIQDYAQRTFQVAVVCDLLAGIFVAAGLSRAGAEEVSLALIEADQQGLPSHGVLQAENYVNYLEAGMAQPSDEPASVEDRGAVTVIDAGHMLGHLVAGTAMRHAMKAARQFGIGVCSVRHSFHFGAAGRYAKMAADDNLVGVCMTNARAVMPAPGGVEPLVGTNPLAIAVPAGDHPPVVFDMATSQGALGKIHMARQAGKPIPDDWAVDRDGAPTTDPVAALAGMLLPAAGPKGFGLSFMIDLLSATLSGGAPGTEIGPMKGKLTKPMNCSHLFIALDPAFFRPAADFLSDVDVAVERVKSSRRTAGTDELFVPGERKHRAFQATPDAVTLSPAAQASLAALARDRGVQLPNEWEQT